ncbi:MAG: hypothetical protein JWN70_6307 [Planctomycetaceae bacterium]|nr:hypothetical protein [Planctomycetaceae bacterium]
MNSVTGLCNRRAEEVATKVVVVIAKGTDHQMLILAQVFRREVGVSQRGLTPSRRERRGQSGHNRQVAKNEAVDSKSVREGVSAIGCEMKSLDVVKQG